MGDISGSQLVKHLLGGLSIQIFLAFEGGINLYRHASNQPVVFKDPSGLKIMICNRPAEIPIPGSPNHSYMWDTRPGHRNCGRGSKSGQETGPGPGTVCYDVPGSESDAVANRLLDCCERTANAGAFFFGGFTGMGMPSWWTGLDKQPWNDCHTSIYRCLFAAGLPSPPHRRFGDCRECPGRYEYPHEYGR